MDDEERVEGDEEGRGREGVRATGKGFFFFICLSVMLTPLIIMTSPSPCICLLSLPPAKADV